MIGNNHEIDPGGVRLRLCRVPPGPEALHTEGWAGVLDARERERYRRLPAQRGRAFLCARALLRDELSLRLQCRPHAIAFRLGRHGRPYLCGADIGFSLSYSEHWVALITARGPCEFGVDIEERGRLRRDPLRLARRFLCPEEARWLAEQPEARRCDGFLQIWTLKEAWTKALGLPIAATLPGPAFRARSRKRGLSAPIGAGEFAVLRPAAGVALALCRRGVGAPTVPLSPRTLWGAPFTKPMPGPRCEPLDSPTDH